MTDELQQARDEYDRRVLLQELIDPEDRDAAFSTLIEVATREYREALRENSRVLGSLFSYAASKLAMDNQPLLARMNKCYEDTNYLVNTGRDRPQPVPTQEVD